MGVENLVLKAIDFATEKHEGQFRKYTGEPYIRHPIRVECMVRKYSEDQEVLAATVLHDTCEDCDVSHKQITDLFGVNVSLLVWELTNVSKNFPKLKCAERKRLDRVHIAEASADAQLIKCCDRIDNLSDLKKSLPSDQASFGELYAHESLLLADVLTHVPEKLWRQLVDLAEELLPNKPIY